jgi:thioredoxin reductase (NADPH)
MYDVIIIGKGPAGLSAALYTVRAKLNTLVIGRDDSVLRKAGKVENYFGFAEAVKGEDLLSAAEKQALRIGTNIVTDDVISVEKKDFFEVTTKKEVFLSKALLMATGQPQKKVNIGNLEKFEGKGVSYCSTCDGFFYNNLKVGVLGFRDFAIHEALELETFTKDITIYTNGNRLDVSDKYKNEAARFKLNEKTAKNLEGADFLERICFEDGSCETLDGIFIAYESASSIDFARKLGVMTEDNSIIIDKFQQTNLDGLFAAGDCTGGFKQVSVSVGQGALAGRKIIEYVKSL